MAVLLAGIAALCFGAADFAAGDASRKGDGDANAVTLAWLASIVGTVLIGLLVLAVPPKAFGGRELALSAIAAVYFAVTRPLIYRGVERGPVAVFSPVFAVVSVLVPTVLGPLVEESLSGIERLGVVVALPAVALVAAEGRLPKASVLARSPAFLDGVLVGTLIGTSALLFSAIGPDAGAAPAAVAQIGGTLLIPVVALGFRTRSGTRRAAGSAGGMVLFGLGPISTSLFRWALTIGAIDAIANVCGVAVFQRGAPAVAAAVIGFAPAVTIVLAARLWGERLHRWQTIGAALGGVAIVLFALS